MSVVRVGSRSRFLDPQSELCGISKTDFPPSPRSRNRDENSVWGREQNVVLESHKRCTPQPCRLGYGVYLSLRPLLCKAEMTFLSQG